MSTDFIILPHGDSVERLRAAFPDLWTELLELADPETPILMYSASQSYCCNVELTKYCGSALLASSTK